MDKKALSLIQDVRYELGASVLLVASEDGQALLCEGNEEPQTMSLLAALGAAGLSAMQEVLTTSFRLMEPEKEQLLTLEISAGFILVLSMSPFIFLAVIRDKGRLGLARLLLRRLATQVAWENLFQMEEAASQPPLPQQPDEGEDLFRNLWAR